MCDHSLFGKLNGTLGKLQNVGEQLRYACSHACLGYLVPALHFRASIEILPPKAPVVPWVDPPEAERESPPNLRPCRANLTERRPAGRRTVRRQASPSRHIDPATWAPPGERRAGALPAWSPNR